MMELLDDAGEETALAGASEATGAHGYLVGDAQLLGDAAEPEESDVELLTGSENEREEHEDDDADSATFQPLPLRTPRRRRVGKALQLALLRRYVQCAKELGRVPDRATTEQVLDEGFDAFYLNGGNLNEPRMGYAAFLKLVRNRRGEVLRERRHGERDTAHRCHRTPQKKHAKERHEIYDLVNELERVRQAQSREVSSTHRLVTQTPPPADSSRRAATTTTTTTTTDDGDELVLVSKRKLLLLLERTRETLATQTRLLEQLRSLHVERQPRPPPSE